MKDFQDLLSNRRSTRKFTEELLNPNEVEALLKAALKSPSSKNKKPWQFIVVEDKQQLNELAQSKSAGAKPIEGCALAIVVVADPLASNVWIEDASIASILIQLEAENLGLGSCWIQIRERYREDGYSAEQFIKDTLNIPLQLQVLSVIAIGRKAQEKSRIEDDNLEWEKVHIGKY